MTVSLNSSDTRVLEVCRRTLESMGEADVTLSWEGSGRAPTPADLTIWDVDGTAVPLPLMNYAVAQQNVIIASREQSASLRKFLPDNNTATILLKPLTEGPLRVCLQQALSQKKCSASNDEANAKMLLQFALEAIVKLQEYDQDRSNFIARAVHDFRAPLTALKGYCGLLLDQQIGLLGAAEIDVFLRMRHSVERLSRMAEDMFQLAIGNRYDPKLNLQDVDIPDCIEQTVHELRPFIDEKQLQLTVEAEVPPRPVRVDPVQIEQVLINILDNASKFTPRCGSIDIKGYSFFWERRWTKSTTTIVSERRRAHVSEPNAYRIDIQDSGPSIPPEQLATIFEEYISFKGGRDRSGAGLGLAICKLIVTRHQGRVWAESSVHGNMFSIVLPLVPIVSQSASFAS